jgi:hypothetical protein
MARHNTQLSSIVRRLRPSPQRFAAAAALQDPNLLLQYQATRVQEQRREPRLRGPRRPIGPLLDQAKVGILATALLAPALAVAALAPRRTAPAMRPTATSPSAA